VKIIVGFFGIPRSLSYSIESIVENIFEPIRSLGSLVVVCHFFDQKEINNPRSGEFGKLRTDEINLLTPDFLQMEAPNYCLNRWAFDEISTYGDSWGDDFLSLRNLIHQLHSLNELTLMIETMSPDVVLFCRPDLIYHNSFGPVLKQMINSKFNGVYIPFWQWNGGLNDRFALCGGESYRVYGKRIELALRYVEQRRKPLHSESLLHFALFSAGIKLKPTLLTASRVRSNGLILKESFSPVSSTMAWSAVVRSWFC
jgi:hypothetical protein